MHDMKLHARYTLVRVRPQGKDRIFWTEYIYDISASGMRFALDEPLDPGTQIDLQTMLPGARHMPFGPSGRVIRLHDDECEANPTRMGLNFDKFYHHTDRRRLNSYLDTAQRRAA